MLAHFLREPQSVTSKRAELAKEASDAQERIKRLGDRMEVVTGCAKLDELANLQDLAKATASSYQHRLDLLRFFWG